MLDGMVSYAMPHATPYRQLSYHARVPNKKRFEILLRTAKLQINKLGCRIGTENCAPALLLGKISEEKALPYSFPDHSITQPSPQQSAFR